MDQLIEVYPAKRIGLKISPMNAFHGMSDSDPIALFSYLLKELSKRNVGFVEVSEGFMKEPDLH